MMRLLNYWPSAGDVLIASTSAGVVPAGRTCLAKRRVPPFRDLGLVRWLTTQPASMGEGLETRGTNS